MTLSFRGEVRQQLRISVTPCYLCVRSTQYKRNGRRTEPDGFFLKSEFITHYKKLGKGMTGQFFRNCGGFWQQINRSRLGHQRIIGDPIPFLTSSDTDSFIESSPLSQNIFGKPCKEVGTKVGLQSKPHREKTMILRRKLD